MFIMRAIQMVTLLYNFKIIAAMQTVLIYNNLNLERDIRYTIINGITLCLSRLKRNQNQKTIVHLEFLVLSGAILLVIRKSLEENNVFCPSEVAQPEWGVTRLAQQVLGVIQLAQRDQEEAKILMVNKSFFMLE